MSITIQEYHVYNKVFFLNLNELAFFIHPFTLIPMGLVAFPRLGWLQDRMVLIELLFIYSLINFLSGDFKSFAKKK